MSASSAPRLFDFLASNAGERDLRIVKAEWASGAGAAGVGPDPTESS